MTTIPVDILLIEDDPGDAELTQRALKDNGIANNVHLVRDGAEALDFVYRGGDAGGNGDARPRVILLDLKLPKVSGLEVLRRLKSDERTKKIPVVVLTSSREECDVVDSYRLGVNSYIVKPVNFDNFVEAVRELGLYWLLLNTQPAG